MTDQRSPEEIEREIEHERAGLTNTLEDLQDRFSVDAIVRQVGDQLREHGGDIGAAVTRSVKENPMALALTGVGLAWMIFGNRDNDNAAGYAANRHSRSQRHGARSHRDRDLDTGEYDTRPGRGRGMVGQNATPNWMRDYAGSSYRGTDQSRDKTSDKASGAVSDTAERAKDSLKGAGASASDAMHSARDKASDMAQSASDRAADLRHRLSDGLESLSDDARDRVIAARERAMEARDAVADYARQGRDQVVDLFEEQPLIAGALAIAVGAAIGAALPRTRAEDRYFGDQSDELIEEAERIFAEERAKIDKVVKAAGKEAKDMMEEVKDSGARIADAAKEEAEKQNLGKPNF